MHKDEAETLVKDELGKRDKGAFAAKGMAIRFDHAWQKREIEEEARNAGRSVSNFLIRELGKRRKWFNRDPETGKSVCRG